jgi:peroxidase
VGLTAIHTLFVREHNRLVGLLETNHSDWTEEQLFQTARKLVGAEMQAITYREFLPALLGEDDPLRPQAADYHYDVTINASVSNEFATSIYRFGHSMLPSKLLLPALGDQSGEALPLKEAFFTPDFFAGDATGSTRRVEQLLLGMTWQMAMKIDPMAIEDVRNFLFGVPGSGGMDLIAINIQRGRDHGLPGYNEMRGAYGLPQVDTFSEITSDTAVQQVLSNLYDSVHQLDAWVGGLAETHNSEAAVGELIHTAVVEQMTRLRDGDRYFFTGDLELTDNPAVDAVLDLDTVTLSQIIRWNTALDNLPANVFLVTVPEPGSLGLLVLSAILTLQRRVKSKENRSVY